MNYLPNLYLIIRNNCFLFAYNTSNVMSFPVICRSKATLFTDSADHFTEYFRNRYNYIYQRVLRNPIFANKSVTVKDNSSNKYKVEFYVPSIISNNYRLSSLTITGF